MNENTIKKPSKVKSTLTTLLLFLLIWGSAYKTDSTFEELFTGIPEIISLLREMIPPDWAYFSYITPEVLITIQMALLGATFGAILAIPLSLLASSNIFVSPWIYQTARFILNFLRTIPDLLLAAIFVAIFGLGLIPGVLALTIFSLGIIAKLMYEFIETIDPGPLEAMTAVGANKIQWIAFGVIPQIAAQFAAYFLYTFEINIRAAAILGLVGAGGIGLYLDETLNFLEYQKTTSIILYTLVVIMVIDYITKKIREKLL
ncbi:phosphonate ABC transporter, permease protein PhnE [Hazenella sp. IB182357]|uniref:Phosphonate ABC transporter, permease protein PhnE n=1 Tax=Polycladospora coralii TaxID=2771432 RepID=A0A926N840_9BACL|nr:phosphonate ABC transporter, permease protein PhnE [Polycladospora coralii]MBD1371482.1 phosphonate ABC transporter, permease protein PhnE [Polycladospora coralii]MBS7530450.1 phosphonate ABC transporter, permease protein PhnE [Polycladospora coralii]